MRPPGVSKLDPYRDKIIGLLRDRKSPAEIRRVLAQEGCLVSHTTLSGWLARHAAAVSGQGRHSQGGKGLVGRLPAKSLGLLTVEPGGEEDFPKRLRILRILWEPQTDWDGFLHGTIGPDGVGIPLNSRREPDFREFASALGKQRLRSFGDADFILLALWTRPFRKELQTQSGDLLQSRKRSLRVVTAAREIRAEMFDAVGISVR